MRSRKVGFNDGFWKFQGEKGQELRKVIMEVMFPSLKEREREREDRKDR